jgi:hypothetical protein
MLVTMILTLMLETTHRQLDVALENNCFGQEVRY